ncbi:MAG: GAF domain-containing protein [Balneolales bacterium]
MQTEKTADAAPGHAANGKREQGAERKFKQLVHDLTVLLRHSTDVETVMLYWINKEREYFVLETKTTRCRHTMFQDRVAFSDLYLNDYKNIKEPVQLEVGNHVNGDKLTHYFNEVPVRYLNLLPFNNNGETIALTVMESKNGSFGSGQEEAMAVYMNALGNLLQTYLELNDLADNQNQWIDYELKLKNMYERLDGISLMDRTVNEMQDLVGKGGVSLLCRGMNDWHNVLSSRTGINLPPIGLKVEENTIAWDALSRGEPVHSIHFNANPKRISPREPMSRGASLAIPILVEDRRQAVILINAENPLVFSEATKHKMINLSRIASLRLAALLKSEDMGADFMVNEYSAFKPELLEKTIDSELHRCATFPDAKIWLGFITIANLSALRTKLRLEELKSMQKYLISGLNPQKSGINGYLAGHSDYVYAFIMQSDGEEPVSTWLNHIQHEFKEPVTLGENRVRIEFISGFTALTASMKNSYQALREAKASLAAAMKQ